jgi:hypothetical protein
MEITKIDSIWLDTSQDPYRDDEDSDSYDIANQSLQDLYISQLQDALASKDFVPTYEALYDVIFGWMDEESRIKFANRLYEAWLKKYGLANLDFFTIADKSTAEFVIRSIVYWEDGLDMDLVYPIWKSIRANRNWIEENEIDSQMFTKIYEMLSFLLPQIKNPLVSYVLRTNKSTVILDYLFRRMDLNSEEFPFVLEENIEKKEAR